MLFSASYSDPSMVTITPRIIGGAVTPEDRNASLFVPVKVTPNGELFVTSSNAILTNDPKASGEYGFDILSGSGEYSGSNWYAIKTIDDTSIYKASSSIGGDFATNGIYSTGDYFSSSLGDINYGKYVQIGISAGIVQAYREN